MEGGKEAAMGRNLWIKQFIKADGDLFDVDAFNPSARKQTLEYHPPRLCEPRVINIREKAKYQLDGGPLHH